MARYLSNYERDILGRTIAGEIDPRQSPYGNDLTNQEIANILESINTRSTTRDLSLAGVALQDRQYSTWNDEGGQQTAASNYARYQAEIDSAIAAYFSGELQPTHKGITNYYAPGAMEPVNRVPDWAQPEISQFLTQVGPHRFYTEYNAVRDIVPGLGPPSDEEHIANLQQQLARAGYDPGPIDGVFGPRTQQAVMDFQATNGLPVDGVVNDAMIGQLANLGEMAGAQAASPQMSPEQIDSLRASAQPQAAAAGPMSAIPASGLPSLGPDPSPTGSATPAGGMPPEAVGQISVPPQIAGSAAATGGYPSQATGQLSVPPTLAGTAAATGGYPSQVTGQLSPQATGQVTPVQSAQDTASESPFANQNISRAFGALGAGFNPFGTGGASEAHPGQIEQNATPFAAGGVSPPNLAGLFAGPSGQSGPMAMSPEARPSMRPEPISIDRRTAEAQAMMSSPSGGQILTNHGMQEGAPNVSARPLIDRASASALASGVPPPASFGTPSQASPDARIGSAFGALGPVESGSLFSSANPFQSPEAGRPVATTSIPVGPGPFMGRAMPPAGFTTSYGGTPQVGPQSLMPAGGLIAGPALATPAPMGMGSMASMAMSPEASPSTRPGATSPAVESANAAAAMTPLPPTLPSLGPPVNIPSAPPAYSAPPPSAPPPMQAAPPAAAPPAPAMPAAPAPLGPKPAIGLRAPPGTQDLLGAGIGALMGGIPGALLGALGPRIAGSLRNAFGGGMGGLGGAGVSYLGNGMYQGPTGLINVGNVGTQMNSYERAAMMDAGMRSLMGSGLHPGMTYGGGGGGYASGGGYSGGGYSGGSRGGGYSSGDRSYGANRK